MNSKALRPTNLSSLVAQHARRRRARVEDAAVGAEERDRVPAVFDERAEALLAGLERGLRLPLFGERMTESELDAAAARDRQRDDQRDGDEDQDLKEAIGRLRRERRDCSTGRTAGRRMTRPSPIARPRVPSNHAAAGMSPAAAARTASAGKSVGPGRSRRPQRRPARPDAIDAGHTRLVAIPPR